MNLRRIVLITMLTLFTGIGSALAAVEITLYNGTTPSGDLFAAPGTTVGWGIKIWNDTASEITINSSYFSFSSGYDISNPDWQNAYLDFIGGIDPLAPGAYYVNSTTPSYYNHISQTGAGEIAIMTGLGGGLKMIGEIDFTYDGFNHVYVPVSVTTTPEPSTYALLCISLGVVGYARRKLRIKN